METKITSLCLFLGLVYVSSTAVKKGVGETVTLYPIKSVEPLNSFLWSFGKHNVVEVISIVINKEVTPVNGTRFGRRMNTDVNYGSITISNLTVHDSGIFLIQILTNSKPLIEEIHLIVEDFFTPKTVLEGRNVTLATPMEKLEMKHTVNWTKEEDAKKIQIALWKNGLITTEESFKHVLQVDQQTGSLTFIRITRDLRGIYRVKIKQGEEVHSEIVFKITVYEPVCFPNIMKKEFNITNPPEEKICYVTCSVRNGPDVNLTWFNGLNQIISINNTVDLSMNLSLPLGIQPEKKGNYTCQAQNPVTSERKMLSLAQLCPSHDSGEDGNPTGGNWVQTY
ncbi:PREDICTED: CD48 antigen-like isoform X2 [Cyprinodon variegatus]|uniref:CD48 antigen-like isoform X2 n=1 Tax=Cyprinodon variegatus TaxID=28743 RepID=UPI000742AAB6|nr:PREDICTED: CD48 antigen-like isoform X2 [Cyprinodon variegatus]